MSLPVAEEQTSEEHIVWHTPAIGLDPEPDVAALDFDTAIPPV